MFKLYYSPGACSLAPHIVLKELDLPHTLIRIPTGDEAQHQPSFLKINPLAKVPVLTLESGAQLTECSAIMFYLAEQRPQLGLVPTEAESKARCMELVSLIGTTMHPAYAYIVRPDRKVKEEIAHAPLRSAGRALFADMLERMDGRVQSWALGEAYTIADPYLFVMVAWAQYAGIDISKLKNLRAWARRVRERPAVEAALRAEQLVDEAGRPTPPTRV